MWPFNYFKRSVKRKNKNAVALKSKLANKSWRKSVLHVKENVGWKRTVVKNLNVKPN